MNLKNYLREYYKVQKKIVLVSRPTSKQGWSDRCYYLEEGYDKNKHYNHRTILDNEIVIEFDEENPEDNKRWIKVCERNLRLDGLRYSTWTSGNKSIHLHLLVNTKRARHLKLLKSIVMKHYSKGCEAKPDMRLKVPNHLIRAEFGVHEKTGKNKTRVYQSRNYFELNEIPASLWQEYSSKVTANIRRTASKQLNQLGECDCVKYIATSHQFRSAGDGHERAMFFLIHHFKNNYNSPDDLAKFMIDWYRYSGGFKMSETQIYAKCRYHWRREYNFSEKYIKELLVSVGKEEVFNLCSTHKQV